MVVEKVAIFESKKYKQSVAMHSYLKENYRD